MIYRAAIAGLGRIALLLERDSKRVKPCTHAGTYQAFPSSIQIAGGSDPDTSKSDAFLEFCPQAQFFDSLPKMITDLEPAILSIASPSFTHLDVFEQLKTLPHVPKLIWLEKPLEISLKKAERIARIAKKMGSFVLVNHERRFDPAYQAVRGAVQSGVFGSLKSIHAMMYRGRPSKIPHGSGTLLEDGTHLLDMIFFLTGQNPESHTGKLEFLENRKVEKRAYGTLYFKDFPVFIDSGGERKYFHFELDINLERGRIRIGNGIFEVSSAQESPYYEGFQSLLQDSLPFSPKNMFLNLGQSIIDYLDQGILPQSSLDDALKVMRLSHEIYRKWKPVKES